MKAKKTRNGSQRMKNSLAGAGRALVRARQAARKIARMYGTLIYFLRDGKIVAEKP